MGSDHARLQRAAADSNGTWRGDLGHSAGQTATAGELAFATGSACSPTSTQVNAGRERIFERLDVALQEIQTGHDGVYGWGRMVIGFRLPPRLSARTRSPTRFSRTTTPRSDAYGQEHRLRRRARLGDQPGAARRDSRRGWSARLRPQNRHVGYEHRRARLELPDCRLRSRRFCRSTTRRTNTSIWTSICAPFAFSKARWNGCKKECRVLSEIQKRLKHVETSRKEQSYAI